MARKKKFIVVPRTQNAMLNGIQTSKGRVNFKSKGATYVSEDVANEIDFQHGLKGSGDVWIDHDENLEWHERNDSMTNGRNLGIHHYTFSGVDISIRGGGERVKVKTKSGFTYVSREVAIEEGYKILREARKTWAQGRRQQYV